MTRTIQLMVAVARETRMSRIILMAGLVLGLTLLGSASADDEKKTDPKAQPKKADDPKKTDDKDQQRRAELLKKFKEGTLNDKEKAELRPYLQGKAGQGKNGRMTPSATPETVGTREITELQFESSDKRKIAAVLSMPKGDGPFPVVVTIHGGQGDRDYDYIRTMAVPNKVSPTVSALNDQPWAVLAISYRSGDGALFGKEENDVVAGIRFAKTLPKIDAERVGVVGGSHGGHLALRAAEIMGKEFRCVAVGSPWCTDPQVYIYGKADQPPLSDVPEKARVGLMDNGKRLRGGLERRVGGDSKEVEKLFKEHSIEANAEKIVIPALFITSTADEQAPHVLVKPTIDKLKAAGRDVTVYTAEKSPHGFYWGREVGGARLTRGEKTDDERAEEAKAREMIVGFFKTQFDKKPAPTAKDATPKTDDKAKTDNKAKTEPKADPKTELLQKEMPSEGVKEKPQAENKADRSLWVTPAVRANRVKQCTFESTAAKTKVSYHIYTPEIYHKDKERRFPVLYWLHGSGGGLAGIKPLSEFFDEAIRKEKIPPMLIVFPNGMASSMWCDSKDGKVPMEQVVIQELLPLVDRDFRTIAKREGRLIEGFSMGGYGAARLGFKHPEMFAAISILAGGPLDLEFKGPRATGNPKERESILQNTFGGDLDYYKAQSPVTAAEIYSATVKDKTRVRMAVGARDNTAELNRAYSEHLKKLKITHDFTEVPGVTHDTLALLKGLGDANWVFYRKAFDEDKR
jgi:enterochelin esterase-like enzyme